jgi:site-specific recombinase XerD
MEKRKRLDQFTKYINKHLRKAAGTVGIDKHLTSYWARHSWATIASNQGIDKDTIAKALGHGGNTVTDIYIDFDLVKVDQANRIVIESVC